EIGVTDRTPRRPSFKEVAAESSSDQKTGAAWGKTCPLISPPGFICVWMFTYQRPENRSVMSWIMSGGAAGAPALFCPPARRGGRAGAFSARDGGEWKVAAVF